MNAGLNWLWIPDHGGLGAAWATLLSYTLAWVLTSHLMPALRDSADCNCADFAIFSPCPANSCTTPRHERP